MSKLDATKTITPLRKTRMLGHDETGTVNAAALLNAGGVVALPTETVYGLAARAANPSAVRAIFAAKKRPAINPLIVHVLDSGMAEKLAVFDDLSRQIADIFWPGALTLVLPVRADANIAPEITAGLETIAIRAPAHPIMRAVIEGTGPLAAPSANLSGRLSPTRASHVLETLDGRIDAVIDGGDCPAGLESTVVMPARDHVAVLRLGPVTIDALERALNVPVIDKTGGEIGDKTDAPHETPSSPGQLLNHYAPKAALRLNEQGPLMLAFGGLPEWAEGLDLSPKGNLEEAAQNLFAMLHRLDRIAEDQDHVFIYVAQIPDEGIGRAINDRLRRAAASSRHLDPHKPRNGQ